MVLTRWCWLDGVKVLTVVVLRYMTLNTSFCKVGDFGPVIIAVYWGTEWTSCPRIPFYCRLLVWVCIWRSWEANRLGIPRIRRRLLLFRCDRYLQKVLWLSSLAPLSSCRDLRPPKIALAYTYCLYDTCDTYYDGVRNQSSVVDMQAAIFGVEVLFPKHTHSHKQRKNLHFWINTDASLEVKINLRLSWPRLISLAWLFDTSERTFIPYSHVAVWRSLVEATSIHQICVLWLRMRRMSSYQTPSALRSGKLCWMQTWFEDALRWVGSNFWPFRTKDMK